MAPLMKPWAYNALEWLSTVVTFCLISVRLYIRVYRRGNVFSWKTWKPADVLIVITWILFLAEAAADTYALKVLHYPVPDYPYTDAEIIAIEKLLYFTTVVYWFFLYFIRMSIIFFMMEWIPRAVYKTWLALRIIGGFTFLAGLSTVLYTFFWCLPVSERWSLTSVCWADPTANRNLTIYQGTISLATDVAIFIIPFFVLKQVTTFTMRQRIGVGAMFGLGIFSIAFCSFNFWIALGSSGTNYWSYVSMYVGWAEQTSLFLVQCVPAMNAFVQMHRRKSQTSEDGGESGKDSSGQIESQEKTYSNSSKMQIHQDVQRVDSNGSHLPPC